MHEHQQPGDTRVSTPLQIGLDALSPIYGSQSTRHAWLSETAHAPVSGLLDPERLHLRSASISLV